MVASGEGWGEGIVRELGKDMYTPGFSGRASGKEPSSAGDVRESG